LAVLKASSRPRSSRMSWAASSPSKPTSARARLAPRSAARSRSSSKSSFAHYAINEDGSDYDDDVGGPAYVAGRDGIDIEPLAPAQDATARRAAQKLFEQIEQNAG